MEFQNMTFANQVCCVTENHHKKTILIEPHTFHILFVVIAWQFWSEKIWRTFSYWHSSCAPDFLLNKAVTGYTSSDYILHFNWSIQTTSHAFANMTNRLSTSCLHCSVIWERFVGVAHLESPAFLPFMWKNNTANNNEPKTCLKRPRIAPKLHTRHKDNPMSS